MPRPGASGCVGKKIGQDSGTDRGEHAHPGYLGWGSRAVGERRPERRRAQPRQHGGGAGITQLVMAATRGPQQPRADTRLEALNLIKIAHQAPPTHA